MNQNMAIINELGSYPNIGPFLTYQDNILFVKAEAETLSFDLNKIDFTEIYTDKLKSNLNLMNIQSLAKILEIESKKDKILDSEGISFDKYIFLIKNESEETDEIKEFEDFMRDAVQYQSYLARDLENVVLQYTNYMKMLEGNPVLSKLEVEAIKTYKKIVGKDNVVRHTIAEEYAKRGFSFIYFLLASLGVVLVAAILLMIKS